MTTNCKFAWCNHPIGPCNGACLQKIEEWREEARSTPPADAVQQRGVPDIDATLTERGNRYGKFVGHAFVTQNLKRIIHDQLGERGIALAADQQEALEMICHKIGRIVNGDPNYADSWVDIAGYAKLVADRLEGVTR